MRTETRGCTGAGGRLRPEPGPSTRAGPGSPAWPGRRRALWHLCRGQAPARFGPGTGAQAAGRTGGPVLSDAIATAPGRAVLRWRTWATDQAAPPRTGSETRWPDTSPWAVPPDAAAGARARRLAVPQAAPGRARVGDTGQGGTGCPVSSTRGPPLCLERRCLQSRLPTFLGLAPPAPGHQATQTPGPEPPGSARNRDKAPLCLLSPRLLPAIGRLAGQTVPPPHCPAPAA